jgi:acetyltransferase-like isoleucine patch superfamily enzyme
MTSQTFQAGQAISAAELSRAGLLLAGTGTQVSPAALFVPADQLGTVRPVTAGDGCRIGPFAVIYGGTVLHDGAQIEEHAVAGKPEHGYAVGHIYPGGGDATVVGAHAVIRSGAVVYAGTEIGGGTVIGHHTLLRSHVRVGEMTQLGHHLTVEREVSIGAQVRGWRAAAGPATRPGRGRWSCPAGRGGAAADPGGGHRRRRLRRGCRG